MLTFASGVVLEDGNAKQWVCAFMVPPQRNSQVRALKFWKNHPVGMIEREGILYDSFSRILFENTALRLRF